MQHIVFLNLHYGSELQSVEDFLHDQSDWMHIYEQLLHVHDFRVTVIQRWPYDKDFRHNLVDWYFLQDNLPQRLRWMNETDNIKELISTISPSVLYFQHMDPPMHFRWMRSVLPSSSIVIGRYQGERIWHNKKIWLQQFGLRTADAFFFNKREQAHEWLKRAVILPCQPIFEMNGVFSLPEQAAVMLAQTFRKLLKWRSERETEKATDVSLNG